MKIGDKVRVTSGDPNNVYKVGDIAIINGMARDGDAQQWVYEADFNDQGNEYVEGDGIWYVDETCVEVIEHASTH